MPTDSVLELCNGDETIIKAMAADPHHPVSKAIKGLFKDHKPASKDAKKAKGSEESQESELDRAARCGKFPYRPSDLFLQIYNDVLSTLEKDPLASLVSPSLLGSSGVIPLTICSVIPDIIRHYAELIVRAQSEIFLATNYWEHSNSASLISDSLRELSRRTEARGGKPVVVKLMYDRGTPSQVIQNHAIVEPKAWSKVGLPQPEEMPFVQLEVVNYHRPPLGTFHAKYMIVDRKVACIDSNNIQDRPNVELMVHVEGPIVDGFYDMALWSWHRAMDPPLPLLQGPTAGRDTYAFDHDNEYLKYIDQDASAIVSRKFIQKHHELAEKASQQAQDDGWYRTWAKKVGWIPGDGTKGSGDAAKDADPSGDATGAGKDGATGKGKDKKDARAVPSDEHLIAQHPGMNVPTASETRGHDGRSGTGSLAQSQNEDQQQPEQIPLPAQSDSNLKQPAPQIYAGQNEDTTQPQIYPTSHSNPNPNPSSNPNANATSNSNTNPQDNSANTKEANTKEQKDNLSQAIAMHLNAGSIDLDATVSDDDDHGDGEDKTGPFLPHIIHARHEPVPIVLVNRPGVGTPGHDHVQDMPQDVAWLSAFKYARRSVFIQTPTFNASPVVPATLEACRRGVEVTLYLDLGFNDQGEMIPFQGGTNEEVVNKMYKTLNGEKDGKEKNLRVYWYTSKDQRRPLSAAAKKRNCHVKFMAVDDQVAILGNGNQDTQSWFHSQEINIMIDSPPLVAEWLRGIDANQNTRRFGRVSEEDGIYRDGRGEVVEATGVKSAGILGRMKGFGGAIARVRGTGGF